ncbi:MAG: TetR/AcrR family transcriptional regulator [Lachnospiraceae bacterium]|nr:TetR/AcrR family transcriptional regulator [Lachnospiraceae bacterium]
MIKGTPELIARRREEIINACEALYQTMGFRDITLKEIGKATSFSRPTIYNYFETKEEIFLALFQREYDRWNDELTAVLEGNEELTKTELAEKIAGSLAGREQLLKLLSMNHYDMEENSRQEQLVEFKKSYGRSLELVSLLIRKFCPEMTEPEIRHFIYVFFPFMFGIYPYTEVTEKQRNGMKEAGISFMYQTAYDLIFSCLIRLLDHG